MSTGLRDQRVGLYTFSNTGTNGLSGSAYTRTAERWGRIEPASARERTVGGQTQQEADVIVTLADEAAPLVDRNGLAKVGTTIYKITAVELHRTAREVQVMAVNVGDEVYDQVTG